METPEERPASADDIDFLYRVFASTRADELALAGWPEPQQEAFLRMQFRIRGQSYAAGYPDAQQTVLLAEGASVGSALVCRRKDEISLVDIAILPEFRGRGLGARWILRLIGESVRARVPLRLSVFRGSRAVSLYARLGFRQISEDGMYIGMEYRAMDPAQITRRAVSEADRPFLYILYADVRAAELAQIPWDDQQKSAFLDMQFKAQLSGYGQMYPSAAHEIIEYAGEPAGRVYWSIQPAHVRLVDLTIAPSKRNIGIGSLVLREILKRADAEKKPANLYVESFNPSRALFERLGFVVMQQDGFQLFMERPAGVSFD